MRIGIILFFTFIAVGNLLHPGLPPTHDGEYHVIRFYQFNKVLSEGVLYPRWAPDLNKGYGLPLFNYVYPLPNYVAVLLHGLGTSFIDAFKLNMFIASFLGAIWMFLWVRLYFGTWGGVVASVFYTYAPYHLLDIYIRGSVGEVWALAFFPAFLWSATKLIKERKMLFLPLTSLFLALIIFSHNILSLMFFPFAISYMLFLIFQQKRTSLDKIPLKRYFVNLFLVVALGFGLASIFWLPAIFERAYVRGLEIFDYSRHFAEFYQLIFPSWGSGFSGDETTEGLSFQIGLANLIVIVVTVVYFVIVRKQSEKGIKLFMLCFTLLSIFFMLELSSLIWKKIPFIQYFQFPWRFLSVSILCCSFLAGGLLGKKMRTITAVSLLLLPVMFGIGYTKPAYYHMRDDMYYLTRSNFIDGTNSPGNTFNTVWFNESLPKAAKYIEEQGDMIKVNVAYFPGWQVFVDGKKVETSVDKSGVILAKRPAPEGVVEIKFLDTQVRTIANGISLVSFGFLSLLLLLGLRARMGKKL